MNNELEKKYLSLITDLKMLAMRTKDESEAKRYKALYKQLQSIREQRHLSLIGEEGETKRKYREILEFVDNNYSDSVDSAKDICRVLFKDAKERDKGGR